MPRKNPAALPDARAYVTTFSIALYTAANACGLNNRREHNPS